MDIWEEGGMGLNTHLDSTQMHHNQIKINSTDTTYSLQVAI